MLGPDDFTPQVYQTFKKEIQLYTNSSRKLKRKKYFPTNFMMPSLPCKPKPKTVQKKNTDANNSSKKFVK